MKTNEQIREWFSCDADMAEILMGIQQAGYDHGQAGWYPDGDFSSDADWCYGVGEQIQKAELLLEDDDGSVFDLYLHAHAKGMQEYEHNYPDDDGNDHDPDEEVEDLIPR